MVCITFGVLGSILFEWRTGLTSLGLIPLIVLSQAIQFTFINGLFQSKDKIYSDSSVVISESIINIRTTFSLGAFGF